MKFRPSKVFIIDSLHLALEQAEGREHRYQHKEVCKKEKEKKKKERRWKSSIDSTSKSGN